MSQESQDLQRSQGSQESQENAETAPQNNDLFHPEEEIVYDDKNLLVLCQKIKFKRQKKFGFLGVFY